MSKIYDVIVLGAGPAGLAAGLYAGRSRLSVLIVEKGQDGGQISITDEIENYPGQVVDQPESGPSLIARMTEQAKKFGAERVSDTIKEVSLEVVEIPQLRKLCILQNLQEKLQSFTDVMSYVQRNPFRRKLLRTTNFTLCGIQLLRKLEEMESFPG